MSDIVERLKDWAQRDRLVMNESLVLEAAAEIIRLRAQLHVAPQDELAEGYRDGKAWRPVSPQWISVGYVYLDQHGRTHTKYYTPLKYFRTGNAEPHTDLYVALPPPPEEK